MKKKFSLGVLLLIIAYTLFNLSRNPIQLPDLTFNTITGKQLSLNQLRGKTVLVTFWATNCPSCVRDVAHLLQLYHQYHTKGLEIIAIAMMYNPPNHVVEFTKTNSLPYHVVLDLKGDYAHAFGDVALTPNNFLISPNGTIVLHQLGMLDLKDLQSILDKYLIVN